MNLHSVPIFEESCPCMEEHDSIKLYLDRYETGNKYTKYALLISDKYEDKSRLYRHYKDLNNWLVNFVKAGWGKVNFQALIKGKVR